MALANDKPSILEILAPYTISLNGNKQFKKAYIYNSRSATIWSNVYDLLIHCKWIPKALFNGYDSGYINQQIIKVDVHQWIHHK